MQCHDPVDYEKTIEYSFDVLLIKSTDGIEMLIRNDYENGRISAERSRSKIGKLSC